MRKKLLIIAVIVVAVIGGALAVLLFNLEGLANSKKDFFLARAESAIGRKVSLEKIGVTLRGGIGVRLVNFAVADDPAFSSEPFVRASDLQVNVKLLPLLRKEFQVKRVILREPVITVIRDENGNMNFRSLMRPMGESAAPVTGESGRASGGTASDEALAGIVVSLLNIEDGEVRFIDLAQGLNFQVSRIQTRLKDLDIERPIEFDIRAAVLSDNPNLRLEGTVGPVGDPVDPTKLPVQAEVELGALDVARLLGTFPRVEERLPPGSKLGGSLSFGANASGTLPDLPATLRLDATDLSIDMPGKLHKASGIPLSFDASARVANDRVTVAGLTVTLHNLKATGEAEYRLTEPPSLRLDLEAPETSLEGWEDLLPNLGDLGLTGRVRFDAHVDGELGPGAVPNVRGTASVRDGGMRLPQYPKPFSGIQSDVAFTATGATVENASARVGDSQIGGSAKIESFAPLTMTFHASSKKLALADIKPPNPNATKPEVLNDLTATGRLVVETEPRTQGQVRSAHGSVGNTDYQGLEATFETRGSGEQSTVSGDFRAVRASMENMEHRDIGGTFNAVVGKTEPDVDGELRSGSGTLGTIDYANLRTRYQLHGQEATIESFALEALDGTLEGTGTVLLDEQAPRFDLKTKAHQMDVVKLIEKLPEGTQKVLRAKANLELNISGSGKEWTDIQPTVTGDGLAELFDGAILDYNVVEDVISTVTRGTGVSDLISQQVKAKYPKLFASKNTEFKDLKSTFVVEQGKLKARHLKIDAGDYSMTGAGTIAFDRNLDLGLTFVASQALTADIIRDVSIAKYLTNSQGRIEIPFRLVGTLPKGVHPEPDATFVSEVAQKMLVGGGLEKLTDELIKDDKVKSGLKDLFGLGKDKKDAKRDTTTEKR